MNEKSRQEVDLPDFWA